MIVQRVFELPSSTDHHLPSIPRAPEHRRSPADSDRRSFRARRIAVRERSTVLASAQHLWPTAIDRTSEHRRSLGASVRPRSRPLPIQASQRSAGLPSSDDRCVRAIVRAPELRRPLYPTDRPTYRASERARDIADLTFGAAPIAPLQRSIELPTPRFAENSAAVELRPRIHP
jgi:hypothetical protein